MDITQPDSELALPCTDQKTAAMLQKDWRNLNPQPTGLRLLL